MDKELQILYLEDNPADAGLTQRALRKAGISFRMDVVETEAQFISALTERQPDLILSDHSLPGFNSLEAYRIVKERNLGMPFILLTGSVSEQFAVDCLLAGIDDYILKSNLIRLPSSIERVLSKKQIKVEKETIEKLHAQLQETTRIIEIRNKEVIDSINCAKRIQDAILPHDREFSEELLDGFVIYQPRDIVSGDLYWLSRVTTTDSRSLALKIIAVIDCTGHGIPGAFMSLLVSSLLNETLKNKDINTPDDVLAFLNEKLPYNLNKHNKELITDGLDMALCALDPVNRTVYFSGANRPLWLVRNSEDGYTLIEYKGTKASISANTPRDQVFENNTIALQPGDRLFMFTDGVTDQFGGPKGKKLGRNSLKELLLSSSHLPMQEQKETIVNYLEAWKGRLEQVDDILMLGISIR